MQNKKLHIVGIIFSLLLFSSHKSKACNHIQSPYKINCNFTKKAIQVSNPRSSDFIMMFGDMDTDDETCNKIKYRFSGSSFTIQKQYASGYQPAFFYFRPGSLLRLEQLRPGHVFSTKAGLSISVCCLKI